MLGKYLIPKCSVLNLYITIWYIYLNIYLVASFKGQGGHSSLSNFKIFTIFYQWKKKHVLSIFIIIPKTIILCTGKWELRNLITMINYLFLIEILEYICFVQRNNTLEPDKNWFFCSVCDILNHSTINMYLNHKQIPKKKKSSL